MSTALNVLIAIAFVIACTAIGYYLWPLLVGLMLYRIAMRIYRKHYPLRTKRAVRYTHAPSKRPLTITYER